MRFDVVPSKRRTRPHLSSPRNHVRPSPISTPRHIRADVFHGKREGETMTKLREQVLDERLGLESNELMADYFYPRPREMSTARLTTLWEASSLNVYLAVWRYRSDRLAFRRLFLETRIRRTKICDNLDYERISLHLEEKERENIIFRRDIKSFGIFFKENYRRKCRGEGEVSWNDLSLSLSLDTGAKEIGNFPLENEWMDAVDQT